MARKHREPQCLHSHMRGSYLNFRLSYFMSVCMPSILSMIVYMMLNYGFTLRMSMIVIQFIVVAIVVIV